jgi:hypothetical protein
MVTHCGNFITTSRFCTYSYLEVFHYIITLAYFPRCDNSKHHTARIVISFTLSTVFCEGVQYCGAQNACACPQRLLHHDPYGRSGCVAGTPASYWVRPGFGCRFRCKQPWTEFFIVFFSHGWDNTLKQSTTVLFHILSHSTFTETPHSSVYNQYNWINWRE